MLRLCTDDLGFSVCIYIYSPQEEVVARIVFHFSTQVGLMFEESNGEREVTHPTCAWELVRSDRCRRGDADSTSRPRRRRHYRQHQ
jgi:hypothetical protein